MTTETKPELPPAADKTQPIVGMLARICLEPNDERNLRVIVVPLQTKWLWQIWDDDCEIRIPEDSGIAATKEEAATDAKSRTIVLLRREIEGIENQIDQIEEDQFWDE